MVNGCQSRLLARTKVPVCTCCTTTSSLAINKTCQHAACSIFPCSQWFCKNKGYDLHGCVSSGEVADVLARCMQWCADNMPGYKYKRKKKVMVR